MSEFVELLEYFEANERLTALRRAYCNALSGAKPTAHLAIHLEIGKAEERFAKAVAAVAVSRTPGPWTVTIDTGVPQ